MGEVTNTVQGDAGFGRKVTASGLLVGSGKITLETCFLRQAVFSLGIACLVGNPTKEFPAGPFTMSGTVGFVPGLVIAPRIHADSAIIDQDTVRFEIE